MVLGEHHEVGAVEQLFFVVAGHDARDSQAVFLGHRVDDRHEVDVAVGDVDDDHAVGLQVLQVDLEGFVGEQVDGRGVAVEGVEGQDVEVLRIAGGQFLLEGETGVGEDDVDGPSQSSR